MSLIIKGAKMPSCCSECLCSGTYGCRAVIHVMTTNEMKRIPDWCPLIEVATPHGPLVDIAEVIDLETLCPVSFAGLKYTEILEGEG